MNDTLPTRKLVALSAAIAIGVFIGLFAFEAYERYQLRADLHAISRGIQDFATNMDASIRESNLEAESRAAQRDAERRRKAQIAQERGRSKRERSDLGQMLARRCYEWQQANLEFESISSRQGEKKACGDFESYLATGRPPPRS